MNNDICDILMHLYLRCSSFLNGLQTHSLTTTVAVKTRHLEPLQGKSRFAIRRKYHPQTIVAACPIWYLTGELQIQGLTLPDLAQNLLGGVSHILRGLSSTVCHNCLTSQRPDVEILVGGNKGLTKNFKRKMLGNEMSIESFAKALTYTWEYRSPQAQSGLCE